MKNIVLTFIALNISLLSFSQIKINSSGKVGIGGNPTTNNLKVYGSISSTQISGTHITAGSSVTSPVFQTSSSANTIRYYGYMGGTPDVGIGIAPADGYTLTINGSGLASGGIWQNSDIRLKKDISSISGQLMLDKISLIDAKKYQFKTRDELLLMYESSKLKQKIDTFYVNEKINGKDTLIQKTRIFTPNLPVGEKYGFIAQEIKDIFPEMVKQDSSNGTYAIDYISFVPVLLQSINEQQNQIKSLQEKIDKLTKNELKSLTISTDEAIISSSGANELMQNTPNPFSKITNINYFLENSIQSATLSIYNLNGTQLKSINLHQRGNGSVTINGGELEAGMYIYALIADGQIIGSKTMLLTE